MKLVVVSCWSKALFTRISFHPYFIPFESFLRGQDKGVVVKYTHAPAQLHLNTAGSGFLLCPA